MNTSRPADIPSEMTTNQLVNNITMEPPWVFDDYPQRLFVAVSLVVITVSGLIGNVGTIAAVGLSRKLQTTANAFVVNLSVASSLALATLPFTVANMIHNQETSILPPDLCSFAGIMSYIGFSGTIVAHVLIAIDRVIRITRPNHQYHRIFKKRTVALMVLLAWVYANLSFVLALITHTEFGYSQKYRVCLPDIANENVATVSLFRATTIDLFILICVFVCYTVIFVYIYRHNKRLLRLHRQSHRAVYSKNRGGRSSNATSADTNGHTQSENAADIVNEASKDGTPRLLSARTLPLSDADFSYENPSMVNDETPTRTPAESDQQLSTEETSSETSSVSNYENGNASVRTVSSNVNDQGRPMSATPSAQNVRLRSQLTARQVRITMNMFLVVAVFSICITPYITCLIIDSFERIFPYVAVFYALSNAINPVIYAWKHPQFRMVIKPMFCCRWSQIPEPTGIVKALRDYQRREGHR